MAELKKILIVDDDSDILDLYKEALTGKNYQIDTASDGEEALVKITESKPSLVLLDIMLPNMHGIEVLNRIRSAEKTKNLKVIIMSALSDSQTMAQARELGITDFIVKAQYSLPEVVARVEKAL